MKITYRLLPLALFLLFYALIQVSFTSLRNSQEKEDAKETKVFQEILINRFQQYLEMPYLMALLGTKSLTDGNLLTAEYESYASVIQKYNPEILGFNVVNDKGVIVRAFPTKVNDRALGRVSQNYGPMMESISRKETFYLSPPFRLFQGKQGFVFYMPVFDKKKLEGWYTVVISSEAFIEKFSLEKFIQFFNVLIVDDETNLDYFATSLEPNGTKVFDKKEKIYGRNVSFKIWRKQTSFIYKFPWYFSFIMALILAAAAAYILRLYEQRKKVSNQLENVSVLLRVTSKEALTNLIEIHRELNELNLPEGEKVTRLMRDINYLTNLVEQIDLLETMAHTREGLVNSENSFLDLLNNQLNIFSDVLIQKKIHVAYDEEELKAIRLKTNMWLFENSVLSNVFSHLLIYVESGSKIQINGTIRTDMNIVTFRAKRIPSMNLKTVTRRLEVAKKVLQLHEGDLREEVTMDEIIVTLICRKH
jgi:sensor domain CHASE-containing protein/predicted outer membrane lipoprotein